MTTPILVIVSRLLAPERSCSTRGACQIEVVVNDAAQEIATLWRVMRDNPEELARQIAMTPFSRAEYVLAGKGSMSGLSDMEIARRLMISFRQGRNNKLTNPTSWRFQRKEDHRPRQQSNYHRLWLKLPDALHDVFDFFREIILEVENIDASVLMRRYDRPDALFYVDPPYVRETRCTQSVEYLVEMDESQHTVMLECVKSLEGYVVLSGYDHPIYHAALSGWETVEREVKDDAGNSKTEVLWLSPSVTANRAHNRPLLFDPD